MCLVLVGCVVIVDGVCCGGVDRVVVVVVSWCCYLCGVVGSFDVV